MPFTMGVIVVLLFLFMSGLYLDITRPLVSGTVLVADPPRVAG